MPWRRKPRYSRTRILSWLIVAAWLALSLLAFHLPGLLPGRATPLPPACRNYPIRAASHGLQRAETRDSGQPEEWSSREWIALTGAGTGAGTEGSAHRDAIGSLLAYELFPRSNLPELAMKFSTGSARSSAGAGNNSESSSSAGTGGGAGAGSSGASPGDAELLSALPASAPAIEAGDDAPSDDSETPWPRWDPKTDPSIVFLADRGLQSRQALAGFGDGRPLTLGGRSGSWAGSPQMAAWAALTDAYLADAGAGSAGDPEGGEGADGAGSGTGGAAWWPELLTLNSPGGSFQVALLLRMAADGATLVPEPATSFLFLLGCTALLLRRFR